MSIPTTMMIEGRRVQLRFATCRGNVFLNAACVKKQQVTLLDIRRIKKLHKTKAGIFALMAETESVLDLLDLAKVITLLEFTLQEAWHFKRDAKYHRFWDMPKCSCPILDNEDRYGSGQVIHNSSCPIHGSIVQAGVSK